MSDKKILDIFKRKPMMDIIRCDEQDYLVWKWSPAGDVTGSRANSIRYGSSLRVKDGEVAVFVYKQQDGTMQDYIEGPFDMTINTANFPVLSSIVGAAFGGSSPFQAEVYFINRELHPMRFFIGNIGIVDLATMQEAVFEAKMSASFSVENYRSFVRLHRMRSLSWNELKEKLEALMEAEFKNVANDLLLERKVPVEQLAAGLRSELSRRLSERLKSIYEEQYALSVTRFDISDFKLTGGRYARQLERMDALYDKQNEVAMSNLDIAQENMKESMAIQREITREGGMLGVRQAHLGAFQIEKQAEVGVATAEGLGKMGSNAGSSMGDGGGTGGGMNPAAMMTSMMMGAAMGGNLANMAAGMGSGLAVPQPPVPPAAPVRQYHIAKDGQSLGPYTQSQLQQMLAAGSISPSTYVWAAGMTAWAVLSSLPELAGLCVAPPPVPTSENQ